MAYSIVKRGATYVGQESNFGQGTQELVYLRLEDCTMPLGREYETGSNIKQNDSRDPGTWLQVSGDVTIKGGLHPQRSTWPTAAPTAEGQSPVVRLFEGALGEAIPGGYGVTHTSGNLINTLAFPTGGEADTPSEMGFAPGQMVFVRNAGAKNVLGCAVIKTVDDVTNKLVLRTPLPAIPGSQAIVYGGYDLPKQELTALPSYEFVSEGSAAFDRRRALGCTIKSLAIDVPATKTATFDASYFAALLVPPTASETGGAPSVEAYTYSEPAQVLFGGLYVYDSTGQGTNYKIDGSVKINFGIKNSTVQGINDVDPNGVSGNILTARDIVVEITPSYESNMYFDLMESPKNLTVTGWFGKGAECISFSMPAGELIETPSDGNQDDHKTLTLKFADADYSGDTGTFGGQDAGNKSFILSFLG